MKSLVIDPACDFSALCQRLDSVRWRLVSAGSQPILPGEPEHAAFERGAGERAHYTFNPVCTLRVIEFIDGPDEATRASLPIAGAADIAAWLASNDERTLLRGLLAAHISPDSRFADRVAALMHHPRKAIALAAARTGEAVRGAAPPAAKPRAPSQSSPSRKPDTTNESRVAALAIIEMLKAQVEPLLRALARDRDGSVAATLRPRPDDYAMVFIPEAADAARDAYETIWGDAPRVTDAGSGSRLECYLAPAGMLTYDNELSAHFPGGYRHIAHLLNPHRTWARWRYVRPGETSGMAYDGLVWCDDHWSWFPKPFRALAQRAI